MRRKDLYYKAMAAALSFTVAVGGVSPVCAAEEAEKDENVYVSLNEDGSVSGIYVVNEYVLENDTQIVDYGDYSEVRNLSSEDEITFENGRVSVNAKKGKFYYQGSLKDAQLPWNISISYQLDGEKISAKDLAGKSGKLKITLKITDNQDSDDEFFDNYLMQGTVTLNTEKCSNITAEGSSQANIGKNRQILYNIMAGQEKTFVINADVIDFEMDAITFQAVPMSFDIDSSSIEKDGLYEKTDEIKDAATEFDDGATDLDDGVKELSDGVSELSDGATDLKAGAGDLKDGAGELKDGTGSLISGASSLSSGASELEKGIWSLKNGLSQLNKGITGVDSGASALDSGAKDLADGAQAAKAGSESLSASINTLSGSIGQMQQGAARLQEGINALYEKSPELTEGSGKVLESLKQIQASLSSITVGADQMQQLLDTSNTIHETIQGLADLADALSEGMNPSTTGGSGSTDGTGTAGSSESAGDSGTLGNSESAGNTEISNSVESRNYSFSEVESQGGSLEQSGAVAAQSNAVAAQKSQNESDAAYLESIANTAASLYTSETSELVNKYAGGIDVNASINNIRNIASNLRANNHTLDAVQAAAEQDVSSASENVMVVQTVTYYANAAEDQPTSGQQSSQQPTLEEMAATLSTGLNKLESSYKACHQGQKACLQVLLLWAAELANCMTVRWSSTMEPWSFMTVWQN